MLAPFLRRPGQALALVFAVMLATAAALTTHDANAQEPQRTTGDAIADEALKHVGTHGGQCWTFVRQVVEDGTGNLMGFGYHAGFIEGGATEVPVASAQRGDIIQLADPSNAGPGVSYAGLHTSIVLENYGDGTFKVVDSNSQWGEMVRVHDYDPSWAAGRYSHIQARAYRFGSTNGGTGSGDSGSGSGAAPTAAPTPDSLDFGAGDEVRVSAGGDCLNLRSGAGTGEGVIRCLPDGTGVTVIGEATAAGAYTWVKVRTGDGQEGWVAASYLEVVEQPAPGSSAGDVSPADGYRLVVPGLFRTP